MNDKIRKSWAIWAKSLGSKVNEEDNWYSDKVAIIRTLIVLQAVITNLFIVINIFLGWR